MKIYREAIVYKVDGNAIKKIREGLGVKRNFLAKKVGISQSFMCDIEHGKRNSSKLVIDRIEKTLRELDNGL